MPRPPNHIDPTFPSSLLFKNVDLNVHIAFTYVSGKAWRYEYVADFPNLNTSVEWGEYYYSSEVSLVFRTSEHALKGKDIEEQIKLG